MKPRNVTKLLNGLVSWCTGSVSYAWGLLPSPFILITLLAFSGVIVASNLAWATVVAAYPAVAVTAGVALLNYWFSRDINTPLIGLTPTLSFSPTGKADQPWVEQKSLYDLNLRDKGGKKIPYDLFAAVEHARYILRDRYPDDYPDGRVPPRVRLGTFYDSQLKIVVTGRNPGKAMIALSNDGVFRIFSKKPKLLHAVLLQALAQIKLRATFSGAMLGMLADFATTLTSLKNADDLLFKTVGYVAAPLTMLLQFSLSRTNFYYRADRIVAECGYGKELMEALDLMNAPNNLHAKVPFQSPAYETDVEHVVTRASLEYWFPRVVRLARGDDYPAEDNSGSPFLATIDNIVMRGGYFLKEQLSGAPRTGNRKMAISAFMQMDAKIEDPEKRECRRIELKSTHPAYYPLSDGQILGKMSEVREKAKERTYATVEAVLECEEENDSLNESDRGIFQPRPSPVIYNTRGARGHNAVAPMPPARRGSPSVRGRGRHRRY